jgi:hypothetical protein
MCSENIQDHPSLKNGYLCSNFSYPQRNIKHGGPHNYITEWGTIA